MGQIREGLGTMASPAELVAALVTIGLLERGFSDAEQAAEIADAGGEDLHRLEMAYALAGAAEMQVVMAGGAAADAGADPTRVSRASRFVYQGANCEDDETRIVLLHAMAQRLTTQVMVLVADSRAGRAEVPLAVYPALLAASALETLTKTVDGETATARAARLRQVVDSLRGAADVIADMAAKAEHYAATYGDD